MTNTELYGGFRCECHGHSCEETLALAAKEYGTWDVLGKKIFMISNLCKCGPTKREVLLEERQAYSLYEWIENEESA